MVIGLGEGLYFLLMWCLTFINVEKLGIKTCQLFGSGYGARGGQPEMSVSLEQNEAERQICVKLKCDW